MQLKFVKRMRKGVKLLNEQAPGWHRKVKISTLDLSSNDNCILGQVFGEYTNGLELLDINSNDETRNGPAHGFSLCSEEWTNERIADMTEWWKKQIRAKRKGNKVVGAFA